MIVHGTRVSISYALRTGVASCLCVKEYPGITANKQSHCVLCCSGACIRLLIEMCLIGMWPADFCQRCDVQHRPGVERVRHGDASSGKQDLKCHIFNPFRSLSNSIREDLFDEGLL